ncbi:hypothetical protein [Frankia gtarii]|uniref:hypothetical protein n=1 Tax=Frankia gtarii TaxID=2950102 RepID=UPI0021C14E07|nr:hypothetical protein [Frankia gtarii]
MPARRLPRGYRGAGVPRAERGGLPARVSGKGSGRVSMAATVCLKPGHRGRLFYRVLPRHGREGERRSFSEDHYATLIAAAHHRGRRPWALTPVADSRA